jgi:hypothetical protein
VWWCLGAIVLNYTELIPDFDLGWDFYKNVYFREWVNTTWFPLGNLIAFFAITILGWAFINLITLGKSDPFIDGNDSYTGIKIASIAAPVVFFISGIVMLRAKYDLDDYCGSTESSSHGREHTIYLRSSRESEQHLLQSAVLESDNPAVLLMYTI